MKRKPSKDAIKNIKDITIALTSTSALLLTILAVAHLPVMVGWRYWVAQVALLGFYAAIAMGALVMYLVVWSEANPLEWPTTTAFYLMYLFFLAGLAGILFVVGLTITPV